MKYSFVVPIYNDGALAEDFCVEMQKTFRERLGKDAIEGDFEIIFVDDGSKNDSLSRLRACHAEFSFVKVIALSRNFGQHIAISCGYRHATGACVGMLNVDQEDPPRELPILLDALESGEFDIVNGLYERRSVPMMAKLTSWAFNVLMNKLTGYVTPTRSSTARVMNRAFLDAYNALEERARFIPGLENWLGFRHGYVSVKHQQRKAGRSTYNLRRRWSMAMASIISFSDFPLRLAARFGFTVAFIGFLSLIALLAEKIFVLDVLPGWTSTLALIVFLGGAQIFVMGIASLYIGRVLAEVQRRPLYVVRESIGFADEALPRQRITGSALNESRDLES